MTPRLKKYFEDYDAYHLTGGNKVTHYLGIPMIVVTLLGLLSGIEFLHVDGGLVLLAAASLWYLALDWKIAIPFAFAIVGAYFLGRAIALPALWTFFVLGWVLQGIGHYAYEKKSPAFFKNLEHVLIGPLWIFARAVGYYRR